MLGLGEIQGTSTRGVTVKVQGHHDLLDAIGHTPTFTLTRLAAPVAPVEVLVKAEWFNPGGSVKDRPALAMVQDALARGELTPRKRILDATSGNTGIGLAMVGAALGYGVTLCLPANASPERKRVLASYGAELILTDPLQSTDGAQERAKGLAEAHPDRYGYLDQYNNPANWRAHYATTGPEIWEQTRGRITHMVAGLGTTGTIMGAGRRLREFSPGVKLVGVQPSEPFHGIEGLKHMAAAKVPGIFDEGLLDEQVMVETAEAQEYTRRLAREEGLFAGTSSGAAVAAALRVARGLREGVVVAILPDGGDRYVGEAYWEEG